MVELMELVPALVLIVPMVAIMDKAALLLLLSVADIFKRCLGLRQCFNDYF